VGLSKKPWISSCFHAVPYKSETKIQIDDDDHNILLTKISKAYLFFKDKRSWKYIRKYKVDNLAHRISETLARIKRNK